MECFYISEDIISEILLRIPAEILITFKVVCKHWHNLISDPKFVYAHLTYHRQGDFGHIILWESKIFQQVREYKTMCLQEDVFQAPNFDWRHHELKDILNDKTDIVSGCNGLLLLKGKTKMNQLYLCNPVTRKCRSLPVLNPDNDGHWIMHWVLVYDAFIQRFTVVGSQEPHRWFLFTPQSHTAVHWRELVKPQYKSSNFSQPIAINKEVHCLSKAFDSIEVFMVSLNVSKGEFGETKVPFLTGMEIKWYRDRIMEVMGYVCVSVYSNELEQLDIWSLRDRKKGLWTKDYSIMCNFNRTRDGRFFLSHPSSTSSDQTKIVALDTDKVFVYDLKNKQWKRINFPVQKYTYMNYVNFVHTNSLVHWE